MPCARRKQHATRWLQRTYAQWLPKPFSGQSGVKSCQEAAAAMRKTGPVAFPQPTRRTARLGWHKAVRCPH
eukprot:363500-Chlamydomonas_euryale.AAC.6